MLDPRNALEMKTQTLALLASCLQNIVHSKELQALDTEWRSFRNVEHEPSSANVGLENFWSMALRTEYGDGSPAFPILSRFVHSLLCLPHSSAALERVFSSVSVLKTKQRNKLNAGTLTGILHTRRMTAQSSCFSCLVSRTFLKRMNSSLYDEARKD